jgi:NADH-quinone oxidoreductase subunit H
VSWTSVLIYAVGALALLLLVTGIGGFFTYVFRKLFADFGQRLGPNRVGPFGALQFLADGVKLVAKEDVIPAKVEQWGFRIAPYLTFVPAVLAFSPLPFGERLVLADVRLGLLLVFAMGALTPLGEIVAGWASNNKYSLLGALRAGAMDIAYEIPLLLSAVSVILLAGSTDTSEIVTAQRGLWFFLPQLLGLFVFLVTLIGKVGVLPFDLAEAESELVSGYVTEYSGMRFGLFFLTMFANVFFIAALAVTLYFGGWLGPFGLDLPPAISFIWFFAKASLLVFFVFWVWNSLPRVRIDQFLNMSWKLLLPLSLVNLVLTAVLVTTGVLK